VFANGEAHTLWFLVMHLLSVRRQSIDLKGELRSRVDTRLLPVTGTQTQAMTVVETDQLSVAGSTGAELCA
jgi:hypothetical protein